MTALLALIGYGAFVFVVALIAFRILPPSLLPYLAAGAFALLAVTVFVLFGGGLDREINRSHN